MILFHYYVAEYHLYYLISTDNSRHSISPLSRDLTSNSAVARLVANGILYISQSLHILSESGSCAKGFSASLRKITRSIWLCSICAHNCWSPPRCPARNLCIDKLVTSSISLPVVPVAKADSY